MNRVIKHSLDGIWDLKFTLPDNKVISSRISIPSNIEPTLKELGLIDDYMPADNEYATTKFEAIDDWTYTTVFDAENINKNYIQQLVFEGIDTIAEIYLNDEKICDCENMHLTYKIDVTDKLKKRDNELKVIIRSSELWAREHIKDMYAVGNGKSSYYESAGYLRKARHQWGWDNAPRLITSGIIRSVYLQELPLCRFDNVYFYTRSIDEDNVLLGTRWTYLTDKKLLENHWTKVTLLDGDKIIYEDTQRVCFVQGTVDIEIPRNKVELWWPSGFGEPKLYTMKIEMLDGENIIAEYSQPFGIRKIRLERTTDIMPDKTGEFVFRVNGEKVFIRGTNWKPLDALASEAHRKTSSLRALQEIINLNCNMVRIWGGGIYEDTTFFEFCDRNGIMIWQDFMLGCEIPPTDEWYCRMIAQEAKQIIEKYRNHPSLAIWCGDNENDECLMWRALYTEANPSDNIISRKILKDAVIHFDPYRCYVDSSPYASDENFAERRNGNMTHFQAEDHMYPPSTTIKEVLRNSKCFFIGETGPITTNAIIANDKIFQREKSRMERLWDFPDVKGANVNHQNDGYLSGWRKAGRELCLYNYGRDFAFEEYKDYTLALNLACAEIFKDIIEYCRVERWTKTGVIWWSLCDMWPMAFNYSIMDWELNKKLPYFWIKNSQQEFALIATRKEIDGELALYAANDTLTAHTVEYTVTAYDQDCNCNVIAKGICRQDKNSASLIQRIAENEKPELWIIKWTDNGKDYTNHIFTQNTDYDVMAKWVKIIEKECGFENEFLELK